MLHSFRKRRTYSIITTVLFLLAVFTLFLGNKGNGRALQNENTQTYFPIVHSNPRQAPVPRLIASVSLGDAKCPYHMAYNRFSGLLYVTNEDSKNVSIIQDNKFAGNFPTGKWPKFVVADPNSNRVYVSHVWHGVKIMQGTTITSEIPHYAESYWPTINSTNGYTYVTDLGKVITIIRDDQKVTDLSIPKFDGHTVKWQLTSDYDEFTGLTYFPSWQHGILTVVDGLQVVDQFYYDGEGGIDMTIDSYRKLAFIANSRARADEDSPNNVSIVDLNSKEVTSIFSARMSRHIALDPVTGYVYATNPENNSVTVFQGKREVATYYLGNKPWGVSVDSVTGLAYVTNAEDNSVSVFRDGVHLTNIELPAKGGFEPFHVTIDEESGRVFILNRSSEEDPTYPDRNVTICETPWVHILQ